CTARTGNRRSAACGWRSRKWSSTASRPTSRCSSGSCATSASSRAGRTSTIWRSAWPSAATSPCRSADTAAAMPYLELSLRCNESEQPRYERALEDVGAVAVTLLDADADSADEAAILEPGVGETPLWR